MSQKQRPTPQEIRSAPNPFKPEDKPKPKSLKDTAELIHAEVGTVITLFAKHPRNKPDTMFRKWYDLTRQIHTISKLIINFL